MPSQFIDKEIEEKYLERILDSANWAPTHKKTEPWRFKVFKDKSKDKITSLTLMVNVVKKILHQSILNPCFT